MSRQPPNLHAAKTTRTVLLPPLKRQTALHSPPPAHRASITATTSSRLATAT